MCEKILGYHLEQGDDKRWRIIETFVESEENGIVQKRVLANQSFARQTHARKALLEFDPQAKRFLSRM